jgi:hypothetical protein
MSPSIRPSHASPDKKNLKIVEPREVSENSLQFRLKICFEMKLIRCCLVVFLYIGAVLAEDYVDEEWKDFKSKYAKQYSEEESEKRFNIFKENLKFIDDHNEKEKSFKVETNRFADLDDSDFKNTDDGRR